MTAQPPSERFLSVFNAARGSSGALRFDAFMDLALYHPEVGYYRQQRPRVGYGSGTDFFTASTSGPVFGELVSAACVKLLGHRDPRQHVFVEIGAEPGSSVLADVQHPFAAVRTVRVGDPLELHGPCVVFSNELFDAQPFRRFKVHEGEWAEIGVAPGESGTLQEILMPINASDEASAQLPNPPAEGYCLDLPFAARRLADTIAALGWTGLFVAFDYGKSWRELIEATPAGTARAYVRHTQHNDLLRSPGEQDLTCHVCWDWLVDALARHGFMTPSLDTQEAFFIRNADAYLAAAIAADASHFTRRKQSLLQLLHGAHLGQKFQVLHGLRQPLVH